MEAAILAAEDEVVRLEAIFAAPDFYTRHAADWRELAKQIAAKRRDRVARLYARWDELTVAANAKAVGATRLGGAIAAKAHRRQPIVALPERGCSALRGKYSCDPVICSYIARSPYQVREDSGHG